MRNERRKMKKRAWKVVWLHGRTIGLTKDIIFCVLYYQACKRHGIKLPEDWKDKYYACLCALDITKTIIDNFNNYHWITRKKLGGLSNFMCKTFKWHKVEVKRI